MKGNPLVRLALALLAGYKRFVSPYLPRACRFSPTCSEYAAIAIAERGLIRGAILAGGRLLRCGPWHPGGLDLP